MSILIPDQISEHFRLSEFACHNGSAYPVDLVQPEDGKTWGEARLMPLVATLEAIRSECGGGSIRITSAYRTLAHNRSVGSHDTSQHPLGRAADLQHALMSPGEFHARILLAYHAGRLPMLGGLGLYLSFVHVDVRPRPEDDHLAQWTGTRVE